MDAFSSSTYAPTKCDDPIMTYQDHTNDGLRSIIHMAAAEIHSIFLGLDVNAKYKLNKVDFFAAQSSGSFSSCRCHLLLVRCLGRGKHFEAR